MTPERSTLVPRRFPTPGATQEPQTLRWDIPPRRFPTCGRLGLALSLLAGCSNYSVVSHPHEQAPETPSAPEVELAVPAAEPVEPNAALPVVVTKPGDTLEHIAERHLGHRMLWRQLMEWNKLPYGAADPLPPGTHVVVPMAFRSLAGASAAAAVPVPIQPRPAAVPIIHSNELPPEKVFRVGEQLTFDVRWFAFTAGQGILTIARMQVIDGTRCWHFVAHAFSKMVFFFKVDDRIESFSSVDRLLPVRFEKHLHEGHYRKDQSGWFDRVRMIAKWAGDPEALLGPDCRDLMGAFYYVRATVLPPPGTASTVCIHTGGKNYQMLVNVLRRETIRVPAGEFKTIVIKPQLKFEGIFRQQGEITIWLTDDDAHVPVLVQSKVFLLGSVNIVLTKKEQL